MAVLGKHRGVFNPLLSGKYYFKVVNVGIQTDRC